MATLSSTSFNFIFFLSTSLLLISTVSTREFRVGGPRGWTLPTGNESETFNHWATRNRFHVGDSLYFKYENDSVLVVDHGDYNDCNTSKPLFKFNDGNTTFRFDRYGFFYFISGEPGSCEAGERMIIRVMVHPEVISPGPGLAPSPQPGGDHGTGSGSSSGSVSGPQGSPGSNASFKTAAESYVIMAALGVASVILVFS
ncbi:early nodulin-like protein 1 [Cocos nucifera]|uniref:Early nodulin-like protein 1 n=1 Tax=Cocos nucifera TaxID=13894 RepID=A0A8K0HWD2_COCNU|nr:early nodulin-like protein 1 [Cocos nucifera]